MSTPKIPLQTGLMIQEQDQIMIHCGQAMPQVLASCSRSSARSCEKHPMPATSYSASTSALASIRSMVISSCTTSGSAARGPALRDVTSAFSRGVSGPCKSSCGSVQYG